MSHIPTVETKRSFKHRYTELRDKLRERLPIKRKRHTQLVAQLEAQFVCLDAQLAYLDARIDAVSDYLLALPSLAASVQVTAKTPIDIHPAHEICLFVSFAPEPMLKPHAQDHIRALVKQGIAVVLIVNTSHLAEQFSLDTDLAAHLSGCLIRANSGFDFAAWAHAYSLLEVAQTCRRLYLVNDSIVGPLQQDLYAKMIARIRDSSADMLGLTENSKPQPHLQSYFLVVNHRLLHSGAFDCLMRGIVNMPTKDGVIAQYETQITRFLRAKGFQCEALFPSLVCDVRLSDDTIHNWARLIEAGFPFIKASVLEASRQTPEAVRLVPERYLTPASRINT